MAADLGTTERAALDVLLGAVLPLPSAVVVYGVREQTGVGLSRPAVDAALKRLRTRGLIESVDEPEQPRLWAAVRAQPSREP